MVETINQEKINSVEIPIVDILAKFSYLQTEPGLGPIKAIRISGTEEIGTIEGETLNDKRLVLEYGQQAEIEKDGTEK